MKHSHKKSFDLYSLQQRYSIRKYHFGAASVLLGTALVLGTVANAQAVQAEEHTPEATKPAEKVEEAKDKKEEVKQQDAVDKSKLLTALSRAKKLESKLYTEASVNNLQASIQASQSLLGKADATEAELSAAESSIQSAIIGLELRSNSDKETVSETPVVKKVDAVEKRRLISQKQSLISRKKMISDRF